MTLKKHFKSKIRTRMSESGETYSQARDALMSKAAPDSPGEKLPLPESIQLIYAPGFDPCGLTVPTWRVDSFPTTQMLMNSSLDHEAKCLFAYMVYVNDPITVVKADVIGWTGNKLVFEGENSPADRSTKVSIDTLDVSNLSNFKIYKYSVLDRARYYYADFNTRGSPVFDMRHCTPLRMKQEYMDQPNLLGEDLVTWLGLDAWDKKSINNGNYDQWSMHYGSQISLNKTPSMKECRAHGVSDEVTSLSEIMIAAQALARDLLEDYVYFEDVELIIDPDTGGHFDPEKQDIAGELFCFPYEGRLLLWEYESLSGTKQFAYVSADINDTQDVIKNYILAPKHEVDKRIYYGYKDLAFSVVALMSDKETLAVEHSNFLELLAGLHMYASEQTTIGRMIWEYTKYPFAYVLHLQLEYWLLRQKEHGPSTSQIEYKGYNKKSWDKQLIILVELYEKAPEDLQVDVLTTGIDYHQNPDPEHDAWLSRFKSLDLVKHSIERESNWVLN